MKLNRRAAVAGAIACAVAPALPAPAIGGVATFDPRSVFAGLTPIVRRKDFQRQSTQYWLGIWEEPWSFPDTDPHMNVADEAAQPLNSVASLRITDLYPSVGIDVEQASYAARTILAANGATHVQFVVFRKESGACGDFWVNGFSLTPLGTLSQALPSNYLLPLREGADRERGRPIGCLAVKACIAIPRQPVRDVVRMLMDTTGVSEFHRNDEFSVALAGPADTEVAS